MTASPDASELPLDGELWRFALAFYARPGVAPACLALQDRIGLDVNVLLLGLFAAVQRGRALDAAEIAAADREVAEWRVSVVQALRSVRSRLKEGPPPAPSLVTDRLRQDVKALELRSEQIELAALEQWLARRVNRSPGGDCSPGAAVSAVARHFSPEPGFLRQPDVADALRIITANAETCRRDSA